LAAKPMIVVATKLDVMQDPRRLENLRRMARRRGLAFHSISSVTGQGVAELIRLMGERIFG
jgi:GTP-binding protein